MPGVCIGTTATFVQRRRFRARPPLQASTMKLERGHCDSGGFFSRAAARNHTFSVEFVQKGRRIPSWNTNLERLASPTLNSGNENLLYFFAQSAQYIHHSSVVVWQSHKLPSQPISHLPILTFLPAPHTTPTSPFTHSLTHRIPRFQRANPSLQVSPPSL